MLNVVERLAAAATQPPKIKNAATVTWLRECIHRSRNEIFSEIRTVTPGFAEVLLSLNPDNRNIRPYKLRQIASDMKGNRWKMNGEAIIFAKTGEMNNGQHRATAIVDTNVSVEMLFTFGVERSTRTTLDQPGVRHVSDYLQMDGVPSSRQLGSITRAVIAYERAGGQSLGNSNHITSAEILLRAEGNKELYTSTRYAKSYSAKMKKHAPPVVIGFCHYVLLGENINDGLSFMEQICTGENLERGDPAFTARERLLSMDKGGTASRVEVILRAWNAYREKRKMKTIPIHGRLPELV